MQNKKENERTIRNGCFLIWYGSLLMLLLVTLLQKINHFRVSQMNNRLISILSKGKYDKASYISILIAFSFSCTFVCDLKETKVLAKWSALYSNTVTISRIQGPDSSQWNFLVVQQTKSILLLKRSSHLSHFFNKYHNRNLNSMVNQHGNCCLATRESHLTSSLERLTATIWSLTHAFLKLSWKSHLHLSYLMK